MTRPGSSGPKRSRRGGSASSPCAPTTQPSSRGRRRALRAAEAAGIETLYDDRDERGGVKLGSMDLIGLPWQVIVGPRGIAAGTVELKRRSTGERQELSVESALARLTA